MLAKKNQFAENLVLIVLIVALVQNVLEDVSILADLPVYHRQILIVLGFILDFLFTIEFLYRSFFTASKSEFRKYFFVNYGWIDFLASVPLLFFNSAPSLFALITGSGSIMAVGGMLKVLKIAKIIRIARVLRLLRIFKIFRHIMNTKAHMVQRHTSRIAVMIVITFIVAFLLLAFVDGPLNVSDIYTVYSDTIQGAQRYIYEHNLDSNPALLESYAASIPLLLIIKRDGRTFYSRYSNDDYAQSWTANDYIYLQLDSLELFIDIKSLNVVEAENNLRYFIIVFLLIFVIVLIYSPHFASTVSDPIHVMRRGFDEAGYNLQVHIPESFKNDEVYRLASAFNHQYLTLKEKTGGESAISKPSVNDFSDIIDLSDSEIEKIDKSN